MFVGSNVDCTDFPDNISWAKKGDNIKILGIYFNSELEASDIEQNWKVRLKNMEHNIIKLHKKNSSLYGKVLLCKSYLLSQVSFILQTLSLPNHVLDNIDSLLFKFVWQKSFSQKKAREKIKRSVLCKPLIEGGLDMVRCRDQQKVFHLKWMHRIVSDNDSLYKLSELADMFFSPVGGVNYILSSSLISDKYKLTFDFSRFWQDILKTWISYHTKETERTHRDTEILKEPLFNNLHINHKGKTIFYSNWVKADIKYMNDLFRGGKIIPFEDIRNKIPTYPGLVIDYVAIIKSIPKDWIYILKDSKLNLDTPSLQISINNLNTSLKELSISNKKLRHAIVSISASEICGRNFWKNKFMLTYMVSMEWLIKLHVNRGFGFSILKSYITYTRVTSC